MIKYCNLEKYPSINSYDAAKLIAILAMIIDHCGLYLFPHEIYLRVIGRVAFPIFFFLIGYQKSSRTYDFGLLILGLFFTLIQHYTGTASNIFNVLVTAFITKIFMDKTFKNADLTLLKILFITLLCAVLWGVSRIFFEYGTLAFLMAIFGYFVRINHKYKNVFFIFCLLAINITTYFIFEKYFIPTIFMLIVNTITLIYLYIFKIQDYNIENKHLKIIMAFISRNASYIYFFHCSLFLILRYVKFKL